MKPHIKMNPSLKKLLFWGVVLEAVIILVSYVVHQDYTETFRHAARYSGRLSAVVFLCTFYNYAKSFPSPLKTNLQLRNLLTLFAVVHLIHFVFLAMNMYLNALPVVPVKLVGGALAYVMIVMAPFKLHRLKYFWQLIYFYYVSLVMIITYIARIKGDFEGAEPFWGHYLALGAFIFCSLIFSWRMRKSFLNSLNS
ncbi:hypothetical protein [Maribacter sp.]